MAIPVFSQNSEGVTIAGSEDGRFALDLLSHVGWGYSFVKTDDFAPKGSGEVCMNILNLKVYPVESFGFELGGDLGWRYIGSSESAFYQHDHFVKAVKASDLFNVDKFRSTIDVFSINVPLLAKFRAGKFSIGAGAEAQFNLSGENEYYYRDEDSRFQSTEYKAKVNTFTYGFVGAIGYDSFCVFAKFYPKSSPLLPEGGVQFNYWTLGIAFDI
jgi:hypothetical protein